MIVKINFTSVNKVILEIIKQYYHYPVVNYRFKIYYNKKEILISYLTLKKSKKQN
jgi:hypothetical protein